MIPKRIRSPKATDLVAQLDKVFSRWVRMSAAKGGYCRCVTCGKIDSPENMDAGHFVGRQHMCTRWDERNVQPQCRRCNRFMEGEKDSYAYALVNKYGDGILAELNKAKMSFCRHSTNELLELIEKYKKKLNEL